MSELTDDFAEALIGYIFQTFNMETEELKQIAEEMPEPVQPFFMSSYDKLILKGKEEGIQIGEERGIQIGEEIAETKKNLEFTVELIKKLPNWSDKEIAETAKVKTDFVKLVRKKFDKNKEEKIRKLTRKLFASIPTMKEKDLLEFEKWSIDLWKNYKKKK